VEATAFGRRYWAAALGLALGLGGVACQSREAEVPAPAAKGGVVLARIGDEVVTAEDLGTIPDDPARTARFLEDLLLRRLASREARRRGLDKNAKLIERTEKLYRDADLKAEGLLRNALYNDIRQELTVSEEDLRAHYESLKARYRERQWTLRIQKFEGESEANAAAAKLGSSGRLDPAQSETIGPTSGEGIPRGLLPMLHEFRQPGDRRVLDLGGTWSIVELVEFQPQAQLPFEQVRDKVELSLRAIRAKDVFRELLRKLRVEQVTVDTAAIEKVSAEAKRAREAPPAVEAEAPEPEAP
jgi:hypothetical protein